jgi:hypothetical protein
MSHTHKCPCCSGDLLERGVYLAPCLGPHDESIYFAVDSHHRLANPERIMVMPGENPEPAKALLWELLDRIDPVTAVSVRRFALLALAFAL